MAVSMTPEQVREVLRIIRYFDNALDARAHRISVSSHTREAAARHAVRYHLEHLTMFNIAQNTVDADKVATWYGYFIWEHIQDRDRTPLEITIHILNDFLGREPKRVRLDDATINQMIAFAKNHQANEAHAIGKVGIYTAFTAARRALAAYSPAHPAEH